MINPIALVPPAQTVFWTAFARIQLTGELHVDLNSMKFAEGQDIKALALALDTPGPEGRSPFREALDVATWSLATEELHPNADIVFPLYKGPQGLTIVCNPQESGGKLALAAWFEPVVDRGVRHDISPNQMTVMQPDEVQVYLADKEAKRARRLGTKKKAKDADGA